VVWRKNLDVRVERSWAHVKDRFLEGKLPDPISVGITSTISALLVFLCSRLRRKLKRARAAKRRAQMKEKEQPPPAPDSETQPPPQA
jgi:hypothetical protein